MNVHKKKVQYKFLSNFLLIYMFKIHPFKLERETIFGFQNQIMQIRHTFCVFFNGYATAKKNI